MSSLPRLSNVAPRRQEEWALFGCRLLAFFAIQGVAVLGSYALLGPEIQPQDLPVGMRLDVRHAFVHLAIGLAGGFVGFRRPSLSVRFMQVFALTYLLLAVFGTFTNIHFGMQLGFNENALHWSLGAIAAAIGFGPILSSWWHRSRRAA